MSRALDSRTLVLHLTPNQLHKQLNDCNEGTYDQTLVTKELEQCVLESTAKR